MTNILYIFISHTLNIDNVFLRIKNMMLQNNNNNYIIVRGDIPATNHYDPYKKILTISCNDKYEGLPEKILKTFKFLVDAPEFKEYTHFYKLDDDMIIKKYINPNNLKHIDYAGNVQGVEGSRIWHIGKCSNNSKWNTQKYMGKFVPWCKGGYGYIISRTAINLIKDEDKYKEHIYEDVYIGILLHKNNIHPISMDPKILQQFVCSPDHIV